MGTIVLPRPSTTTTHHQSCPCLQKYFFGETTLKIAFRTALSITLFGGHNRTPLTLHHHLSKQHNSFPICMIKPPTIYIFYSKCHRLYTVHETVVDSSISFKDWMQLLFTSCLCMECLIAIYCGGQPRSRYVHLTTKLSQILLIMV